MDHSSTDSIRVSAGVADPRAVNLGRLGFIVHLELSSVSAFALVESLTVGFAMIALSVSGCILENLFSCSAAFLCFLFVIFGAVTDLLPRNCLRNRMESYPEEATHFCNHHTVFGQPLSFLPRNLSSFSVSA